MDQLDFPFPIDETKLAAYLTRVCAIEQEQDRLREELREVNETFAPHLPLRALRAATKIVLTTRKLADHPKEPMSPLHLKCLCAMVERHLDAQQQETNAVAAGCTSMTLSGAGMEVTLGTQDAGMWMEKTTADQWPG